jgi:hypothetical protein
MTGNIKMTIDFTIFTNEKENKWRSNSLLYFDGRCSVHKDILDTTTYGGNYKRENKK